MRLHYRHNNLGHHKTMVLLHSFPASSIIFNEQLSIWHKNFNTLTFDLPGFGASKAIGEFNIASFVNAIRDLLDKLGIKARNTIFYGISFGGIIALEYSQKYHVPIIVFESTPFNNKMITSKEYEVVKALQNMLLKSNSLELFEQQLKTNVVLQNIFLAIYAFVRPKNAAFISEQEIRYFMQHLDLKTFFEVAEYLHEFNTYRDLKANSSQKFFVYDRFDPTISFSYFQRVIAKFGEQNLITEYHMHAPTVVYGREVAMQVSEILEKYV